MQVIRYSWTRSWLAAMLLATACCFAAAGWDSEPGKEQVVGRVLYEGGKPVADATVRLKQSGPGQERAELTTKSNASGDFVFGFLKPGNYLLSAAKASMHSEIMSVDAQGASNPKPVEVVLKGAHGISDPAGVSPGAPGPEFSDKPNFTVAGVTDWTAVGGHGSDTSLRASETMARETLALKPDAIGKVGSVPDAGAGADAEKHRLSGEAAERSGDPLTAVHELEQAAHLDPSEQNYFAWGSELLLHRAVWQAQEVLGGGAAAYPKSARMLTALGAALFAGARYEAAAERLCAASDLNPAAQEPYEFMGKVQLGAPDPLPCIEQRLERFVNQQPTSSQANYLYAMALLKRQQLAPDETRGRQVKELLAKSVTLDGKCGDGYLQLGILAATERDYGKAAELYLKAIAANPKLGDAHYRLAVAYDKLGDAANAQQEFAIHDALKKEEADEIERERRDVKQFQVVQPEGANNPGEK